MKKNIEKFLDNKYVEGGLFILIIICILALILESDKAIYSRIGGYLRWVELVCVVVFSIEYILRVSIIKSFKDIFKLTMLIDLLAILPFYLKFLAADLIFLRAFRLFRVFRVFKIARYIKATDILVNTLKKKKEELIMVSLYLIVAVIIASCLMHIAEGQVQESFSSIGKTMWWAIVTFTTVGYGDSYPVTVFGKIIAAFVATFGIALYSLLTGILGSAFIEEYENSKANAQNNSNINSNSSSLQDSNQELSAH